MTSSRTLVIAPLVTAVVLSVAAFVGLDALVKHGVQPSEALLMCGTILTALSIQMVILGVQYIGCRVTGLPWYREGRGYGLVWNGPKRLVFLLWIAAMVGVAFLAASQARGPENEPPVAFALLTVILAVAMAIWLRRVRKESVGYDTRPVIPSEVRRRLFGIAVRLAAVPVVVAGLNLTAAYYFLAGESSTLGYVCVITAVSLIPLLLRAATSAAADVELLKESFKKV